MEDLMHTAHFDDLDVHQRLTLFTFAILSTPEDFIADKEAIAEGLFEHLHLVFTTPPEVGTHPLVPLLVLADDDDLREDWTLTGILNGEGELAPILPHDSECSPLVIHPKVLVPDPAQDKNPYTILGASSYGEVMGDGPRRLLVLGKICPERASYFGTEPMLVFLDFDLSEEDGPRFHEFPLDLAECLEEMLERLKAKEAEVEEAEVEGGRKTKVTLLRAVT